MNVRKDTLEAKRLYEIAADMGYTPAIRELARIVEGNGKFKKLPETEKFKPKAINSASINSKWNLIKNSGSKSDYFHFFNEYPSTAYGNLARIKYYELVSPSSNRAVNLSNDDLARGLQIELNRLGCNAGKVDGKWGKGSRRAIERYRDFSDSLLVSLEPSISLISTLKSKSAEVCQIECETGFGIRNNKCVPMGVERQIKSKNCKKNYRKFKKKGPIRAFAISTNGRACGSSWNYGTKKLAEAAALKGCKKHATRCRVIWVSEPAVLPESKECKKIFIEWKNAPGHKAIAISGSGQACGTGTKYSNQKDAIDRALTGCRKHRKGCHVISVSG